MQKVNILYVITKLELGGAQKQLLSLIRRLDRERFQPFLFTADSGKLLEQARALEGLTLKNSIFLGRKINPLRDVLALMEIYRCIKKNNIVIVHTHSSKAGILGRLAARIAGVQFIVHTVHGWPFHEYQAPFARRFFISLERLTAGFTDKIIVVCGADHQKGLKNRIGNAQQYCRINYGIDYNEFCTKKDKVTAKRDLGLGTGELLVTNISCFKPQKNPCDFIKFAGLLAGRIPEAKFFLAGDGAMRSKIETMVKKLKLEKRVVLAGWRSDIPEILAATDLLVLTSLWEGLPIAVIEAMASGVPVVVTATGGVQEIVAEAKTGFIVGCKDLDMMCDRAEVLLRDNGQRELFGRQAKDYLGRDFSEELMVQAHSRLYSEMLKN